MSAFAVRNSELESISSSKMTMSPLPAPTAWKPLTSPKSRGAAKTVVVDVERAGEVQRIVDLLAVSSLGTPSLNSSVPILVSILAGAPRVLSVSSDTSA